VAIVQISQITNRKGLAENLPQLAGAELGWSIDTRQLWIGNGTLEEGAPVIGNTEILTEFSDIININTAYTYKGQAAGYTVQTGPTAGDPVTQSLQSWLDQFASVTDFGATGDGTTDDTDAINRALYQLFCREVNPQIRRSLFFPAGVYRVTSSILIPPYATLWGEGLDNSVIQLDDSVDDSTLNAYVARSADSLQQIGVNIGNNGAAPPQYVTISNMGFVNLDPNTDIFLVEDAVNFRFQNVSFAGPLTQANLTTEVNLTRGVAFASTTSLVCDQIVFDGCVFSGSTYGVDTDQQTKGVTITNGKFDTLYRAIQLGTGSVVNGGPTGTRITGNLFDNIYAEGIIFGDVSLNASGHNIFYDVGNHFGGTTTPYTAVIDIQSNNNVSISDMFERADAYSNPATPGAAYPRITLNNTQSIATTNGVETQQGTYARQSGTIATLLNNTVSATTIFTVNASLVTSFNVQYSIVRGTAYRTGVISVTSVGGGVLTYTDEYSENETTGIVLTVTQSTNTVSIKYTATNSSSTNANFSYSVTNLA
jgi:Pectate lyase superfamily protein